MAISYIFLGQPMVGTTQDDFFIGYSGSTGTSNNTVNGGLGDDWVLADASNTYIPAATTNNGSIAAAFAFDGAAQWTIDENPTIGSSATPHATAIVEATVGQAEYFAVTVGAGQSLTVDIDYGHNSPVGSSVDMVVEILDAEGTILRTMDDSLITDGGLGSFALTGSQLNSRDPYGTYTAISAGTYYIRVRPYGDGPTGTFEQAATFVLNLSVTGHTTTTGAVMGSDIINGDDGDDQLFGQGGNDTIDGGLGNDLIHSGSGQDLVHGGAGADRIYGGGGIDDMIHGDGGDDTLHSGGSGSYFGGEGNDLIYAASGSPETLDGGEGIDTLDVTHWTSNYQINMATGLTAYVGESFVNFENLRSGIGSDTITGSSSANVIRTGAGNDTVAAGGGHDTVEGGAGADTLDGGNGRDTLDYSSSASVTVSLANDTASGGDAEGDLISNFENVTTGNGNDSITGDNDANVLRAGAGIDIVTGGQGDDVIEGGSGADDLNGGGGIDTLDYSSSASGVTVSLGAGTASGGDAEGDTFTGFENVTTGGGDDRVTGGSGANVLRTGGGADVVRGGVGNDAMYGGDGDDLYYVDAAGDTVVEAVGAGQDLVRSAIDYVLTANVEDLILGGAARDGTGNNLANSIIGAGSANVLLGMGGDDILRGKEGRDTLDGGAGADLLDGGVGKDTMTGGTSRDVFQFRDGDFGPSRALADVITDFRQADLEKIHLGLVDADTVSGGNQAFIFIGDDAFGGVAGELRYAKQGGVTYVEGDTDGDGTADIYIALTGNINLVAADFIL